MKLTGLPKALTIQAIDFIRFNVWKCMDVPDYCCGNKQMLIGIDYV